MEERYGTRVVAFASRKSAKKLRRNKEQQNEVVLQSIKSLDDPSSTRDVVGEDLLSFVNSKSEASSVSNVIPSRSNVLQACILTSGVIAALGFTIRQISPLASEAGLPFFDCSQVSFGFEVWHLELIVGLVVLISVSRYTLLNTWPDFAESSESANTQVLTSLQTFDYPIVAFLPGITFPWHAVTSIWPELEKCSSSRSCFRSSTLGEWQKNLLRNLGDICRICIRVFNRCNFKCCRATAHALINLIGAVIWYQTSRSPKQMSR